MRDFSMRLFTLTACAMALLAAPVISPVRAAGNGGVDAEKARKIPPKSVSEDSPASGDMRSPTLATWPPRMNNDFDRKAGSGGGM